MAVAFFQTLGQRAWLTKPRAGGDYSSILGGITAAGHRISEDHNSDDGLLEKGRHTAHREAASPHQPLWRNGRFLAFHVILFAIYLFVLSLVANASPPRYPGLPFSPARSVVEYAEKGFDLEDRIQDGSLYTGKPSAQLDKAWHDLLNDENILLEPEYIQHYGRQDTAVEVPEGGRYIGTLNVYHELHCLKRIHHFMYSDHYFPGLSTHQKELNRLHNEHCIDFLRQSAMCHADIGLITYSWHADQRMPIANATSHQCVRWDRLAAWTHERAVDMMKPDWLMHPTMGPAYPDGQGDSLGAAESPHLGHEHSGH
ncbi:Oxidase ustYa [Colletotrichum higginsianum]|uniref:Oxidase ustYa n=1 Tax=Colletotrichum higginsianum TaxID=80884 RepID=A0A4T0VIZ3_9PEZI|nr:Oxidase ustYa [Colletotrichum higginsianum]